MPQRVEHMKVAKKKRSWPRRAYWCPLTSMKKNWAETSD